VNGPVGWLISLGEWLLGDGFTRFDHAFIVLDGGRLIEAQPGGARIVPLSTYADRKVVFVAPAGLTDGQRVLICAQAEAMVGTPYSFLDYAAIALHRFHIPAPGLRRFVSSTRHEICSALCDEVYRRAGVQLFADGRWPGFCTPADLWNLLGRGGGSGVAA
jgi:cell wall-associated NlpC family hydrolase